MKFNDRHKLMWARSPSLRTLITSAAREEELALEKPLDGNKMESNEESFGCLDPFIGEL